MKKIISSILVSSLVILSACVSTEHVVAPAVAPQTSVSLPASTIATEAIVDKKSASADVAASAEPAIVAAPAKAAEHAHHAPEGVAAEQAMKWLKNGNHRFTKGFFRKDGATKKDVARLSKGQKPHSIVLSCSDSRVPPEVVFDQKLGEIFTVRTAGEVLDSASIASIEYAVEHLGSRNILVMGHSQCGAVKAALSTFGGKDAGSPNLNKLVGDIHPRLQQFEGKEPSANYEVESWANTNGVAKDLLERSSIIAEKVRSGEVQINTALYHLETGVAEFTK
ncbi:MAG: carbonic anhydrase [Pseudobdellovibrio sp.]